ncbi:MAG: hypothetical protein ACRBCK_04710 [Alphaproteobacteria bacterium]
MNEERKLSVYIAEREQSEVNDFGEDVKFHHAFLMLMDETHGNYKEAQVVQQLHFNDDAASLMMRPHVREGMSSPERLDSLELFPYVSGNEGDVLSMWNHALELAAKVKEEGVRFDKKDSALPHANNCRSGVKAAIESMGMTFCSDFTKSASGTKANRISVDDIFSFEHTPTDIPVDELWAENKVLSDKLEQPRSVEIIEATPEALEAFFS